MVRSTDEGRVYGETRSGAIQRWAEVAGSSRRRPDGSPRVANGRLGGQPRARRFPTTARYVSLSRRLNKLGAPVRMHRIMPPSAVPRPAAASPPAGSNSRRCGSPAYALVRRRRLTLSQPRGSGRKPCSASRPPARRRTNGDPERRNPHTVSEHTDAKLTLVCIRSPIARQASWPES
jgi:hypothetical protein